MSNLSYLSEKEKSPHLAKFLFAINHLSIIRFSCCSPELNQTFICFRCVKHLSTAQEESYNLEKLLNEININETIQTDQDKGWKILENLEEYKDNVDFKDEDFVSVCDESGFLKQERNNMLKVLQFFPLYASILF